MRGHGPLDAGDVVLCAAGGMGGYLGPADGLYTHLGSTLPATGIAVVCVDYRRHSHLESSLLDLAAPADRAAGRPETLKRWGCFFPPARFRWFLAPEKR